MFERFQDGIIRLGSKPEEIALNVGAHEARGAHNARGGGVVSSYSVLNGFITVKFPSITWRC